MVPLDIDELTPGIYKVHLQKLLLLTRINFISSMDKLLHLL